MRLSVAATVTAFALAAAMPAHAQLVVTGISATLPDPNNKVPAFNVVPGAGIPTWSNGLALYVLTHGQSYNYCVSLGSGTASGKAKVSFKIARGKTVIQSGTIIAAKDFPVSSDSVWYFCAGFHVLPNSPGAATLTGLAAYTPTGGGKTVTSKLNVPLLLQ